MEISIFIKVTFNVTRADPPTPERHFDAKRGKHRYVSGPLFLSYPSCFVSKHADKKD